MRFDVEKIDGKFWVIDLNNDCERVIGFRLKREAIAQAKEWNNEESRKANFKIIVVGVREKQNARGIHLFDPDSREIENAIETAERDSFETIWIHYPNVVTLEPRRESA